MSTPCAKKLIKVGKVNFYHLNIFWKKSFQKSGFLILLLICVDPNYGLQYPSHIIFLFFLSDFWFDTPPSIKQKRGLASWEESQVMKLWIKNLGNVMLLISPLYQESLEQSLHQIKLRLIDFWMRSVYPLNFYLIVWITYKFLKLNIVDSYIC
jgi:hypothetical protein